MGSEMCIRDSLKCIKSIELKDIKDFGKGCHTRSTEPYFYEAAYQPSSRTTPVPINEKGECVVAKDLLLSVTGSDSTKECVDSEKGSPSCKKWECHNECRPLKLSEVEAIVSFRAA